VETGRILYEEPRERYRAERALKLFLTLGVSLITAFAVMLTLREGDFIRFSVIISIMVLVTAALWIGYLSRQRVRILEESIEPMRKPLSHALFHSIYAIHVGDIFGAKIISRGYGKEWLNTVLLILKSGQVVSVNHPPLGPTVYPFLRVFAEKLESDISQELTNARALVQHSDERIARILLAVSFFIWLFVAIFAAISAFTSMNWLSWAFFVAAASLLLILFNLGLRVALRKKWLYDQAS